MKPTLQSILRHAWPLLTVAALLSTHPVAAQQPIEDGGPELTEADKARIADADRLYQIGLLQFNGREYAAAAASFTKAFDLDPNPVLAYNAGRAHENNGDLESARDFYTKTLELGPEDDLKSRAESALIRLKRGEEALRDKLNKDVPKTGKLAINVTPGGALFVNGERRGTAPSTLELDPGPYKLEVRRSGYEIFYKEIDVEAGTEVVIDAALEERFEVSSWVGWVGGGALAGSVVFGVIGVGLAAEAQSDFDEAQTLPVIRDPDRFDALRSSGEQARDLSTSMYAISGIAALTGVALLVLYASFPERDYGEFDTAATGPRLLFSPTAVGLEMDF